MEGVNGQLQTKYQKIATEYSKIRAQANVLKKAVIDEQTRNNELKEQIKTKDVSLRRAEQELDSLTFRNQQLTKRVTVLQDELDNTQNKITKKLLRNKTTDNTTNLQSSLQQTPNHVYVEEFQKKIVENAQLLSQLSDKDMDIELLNDKIKQLEYKLDLSEKLKLDIEIKCHDKIDKIEKDKIELQKKLNDKHKQDETISWSSFDTQGKCVYDYDGKNNNINNRNIDNNNSPFSTPSLSRRSSKSIDNNNIIRLQKTPELHDDIINNEYELCKIIDLEKELLQYKSDYNILKIKYDELYEKENLMMSQVDPDTLEPVEINNMIGRLKAPFAIPEEIETREMRIKNYFLREIDKLITEKHICQAKNLAVIANSEVMSVHLENCEEKKEKCEAELLQALSNWNNSQEDKDTQEGNYKSQLTTMTEHLANMNEKLICQTEEIQQLKYELENKNGKKGKQK